MWTLNSCGTASLQLIGSWLWAWLFGNMLAILLRRPRPLPRPRPIWHLHMNGIWKGKQCKSINRQRDRRTRVCGPKIQMLCKPKRQLPPACQISSSARLRSGVINISINLWASVVDSSQGDACTSRVLHDCSCTFGISRWHFTALCVKCCLRWQKESEGGGGGWWGYRPNRYVQ